MWFTIIVRMMRCVLVSWMSARFREARRKTHGAQSSRCTTLAVSHTWLDAQHARGWPPSFRCVRPCSGFEGNLHRFQTEADSASIGDCTKAGASSELETNVIIWLNMQHIINCNIRRSVVVEWSKSVAFKAGPASVRIRPTADRDSHCVHPLAR